MAAVFFSSVSTADEHAVSIERLKIKPVAVYQAIHGQSLVETLQQVAQRANITFKVNTDLGNDVVSQSLSAENWPQAINNLLINYNFTTIQNGDNIKSVIITGHKQNGVSVNPAVKNTDVDKVIVIEPKSQVLSAKFRGLPQGAVTAVALPVSKMMEIRDKSTVALDLPMGQFNVAHDYTVNEEDGSKTWVGFLSEEGEGYRVFLSQGEGGIMGMVTTPDGTYNIESDANGVYLVNTQKLQHAGYMGDSVMPSETMLGAVAMKATQSQIDQLQTAVDAAKKTLDAANARVAQETTWVDFYQKQLTVSQNNLTAAGSRRNSAQSAYDAAVASYRANPAAGNMAKVNSSRVELLTAKSAYAAALAANQFASAMYRAYSNRLTADNLVAAKALANYNQVLNALNLAKAAPVTPVQDTSSVKTVLAGNKVPVVDLMVVYTTAGQTAAFAKQRISLLVTASNQAYVDSNINMKLRLVYTEPTKYVENNSNSQALDDLANDVGEFSGISKKRLQYGADLVFLFRPLYYKTAGSCGTTYVEFANGDPANKYLGFGTIGDGNARDNPGYYCAINTFTHEIGHTLGLVHDREYSDFPGVFNYSYAWGVSGKFATIMSYKQPVLMVFSTPSLATKCAGSPCGYAESDTARSSDQSKSVNYTASIVADFMVSTVASPILN